MNPINPNFSRISQSAQKLNAKAGVTDLDAANNAIMGIKESDAFAAGLGLTRVGESNTGGPIVDLSKTQRAEKFNQLNKTLAQGA